MVPDTDSDLTHTTHTYAKAGFVNYSIGNAYTNMPELSTSTSSIILNLPLHRNRNHIRHHRHRALTEERMGSLCASRQSAQLFVQANLQFLESPGILRPSTLPDHRLALAHAQLAKD